MKTLEDILKEYKFIQKSAKVFRDRVIYIDDVPEFTTRKGALAYSKLVRLLYDIGRLTGDKREVCTIIDSLDCIITERY